MENMLFWKRLAFLFGGILVGQVVTFVLIIIQIKFFDDNF